MERLIGPNLEVVLSMKEAFDFGFTNSNFVIKASLDGNEVESDILKSEQLVKLNLEMIWSTSKTIVKKMKQSKVPIRIEFFKMCPEKQKKPFGYVIVSLKTAQYVPRGDYVALKDHTLKVCGLNKDAKGSSPQIVLSLRFQDVDEIDEIASTRSLNSKPDQDVPRVTSLTLEPPREKSSPLPTNDIQETSKSNDVGENLPNSNLEKTPIIRGDVSFMVHHCYIFDIHLKDMKWIIPLKDIHLRFHHARGEISWSGHSDVREAMPGERTDLTSLTVRLILFEAPSELNLLLNTVPLTMTICTYREGRPQILAKASLPMPLLETVTLETESEVKDLISMEPTAIVSYVAKLTDQGPRTLNQISIFNSEEKLADSVKKELEAWKLKERDRMEQEYNGRLKEEINRLQGEWSSREQELEAEATDRMEICRNLSDELQKVMEQVRDKEKSLEQAKTDLEASYRSLLSDTKRDMTVLREELLERLRLKDEVIGRLEKENEKLNAISFRSGPLTKEQTDSFLLDMKKLQEKYESAQKSKAFFKEQWGRVVRELHRVKSDGWKDIQVQLQLQKDELEQLGLSQFIQTDRSKSEKAVVTSEDD